MHLFRGFERVLFSVILKPSGVAGIRQAKTDATVGNYCQPGSCAFACRCQGFFGNRLTVAQRSHLSLLETRGFRVLLELSRRGGCHVRVACENSAQAGCLCAWKKSQTGMCSQQVHVLEALSRCSQCSGESI